MAGVGNKTEYLRHMDGILENVSDPEKKLQKKTNQRAPITLLHALVDL